MAFIVPKVADFDAWKQLFDEDPVGHKQARKGHSMLRSVDNPDEGFHAGGVRLGRGREPERRRKDREPGDRSPQVARPPGSPVHTDPRCRARSFVEHAAQASESPVFATFLESTLVTIDSE